MSKRILFLSNQKNQRYVYEQLIKYEGCNPVLCENYDGLMANIFVDTALKKNNGDTHERYVIDEIKRNPNSRRLVVNAWEPGNATTSKLPPCHYTYVFNVGDGKLSCHLTQRSGDIALGIPFNLAAYSLLTQIIAQETGLELGYFAHTIVDAHIYVADKGSEMEKYDHLEGLKEQLKRKPLPLPQLKIANKPIDELKFDDFELINYNHLDKIKFEVAV